MYSMLYEIDRHIKEKGIPFGRIRFSYDYLPPYLNQAILDMIRSVSGKHFDMGNPEYELAYDDNGTLCLIVQSTNGRNTLAISSYGYSGIPCFDMLCYRKDEVEIIENACMLKYLEKDRLRIREAINRSGINMSLLDKVKLEYHLMQDEMVKKFNEMIAKKENILDKVDYDKELRASVKKITDYIDYLNAYYQEDLKIEEEYRRMDGVYYVEPEKESVARRNTNSGNSRLSNERINSVIPAEERLEVLEGYKYLYREYAYSSSSREIKYMSYIYKANRDNYVIIMEPYNGMAFTRIVVIQSKVEISREDFRQLTKYYLQLSNYECMHVGKVVRSNHTTLDTFKKNIHYVLIGVCDDLSNEYFKEKVRKLKNSDKTHKVLVEA